MKTNLADYTQDSRTRRALVSPTLPIGLALLAGWPSGNLASEVLIYQYVSCLPHRLKKVAKSPRE
jgi:hypothetical protein